MGLDQNWLVGDLGSDDWDDFHYHRKVGFLEDYMASKYAVNHPGDEFNLEHQPVDVAMLDELDAALLNDGAGFNKDASGFFWGSYDPADLSDVKEALDKARNYLKAGRQVSYTSWW